MPLDPQAAAYLERLAALGATPATETPIEESRRLYDAGAPLLFGEPDAVERVEDGDAHGVPVRIYHPAGEARGALVYYHGGGWVLGSFASHEPLCKTLAARAGCAVIAAGYRLAPEHPYPAAVEDAWTVLRWAAERFRPLAVGGDSAGGQLAAAIALRARDAGIELALQALAYPATDYSFDTESYRAMTDERTLTEEQMRWMWGLYVPDASRAAEQDCSPLRAADFGGAAPAYVVTAEFDPLRDEGELYAERLRQAGVPVTLRRYDGLIHGFLRMPAMIDRAHDALDDLAAALRAALGAPRRGLDVVRAGYEYFGARGEVARHLVTDDFVWDMSNYHGWPEEQTYHGADGVAAFLAAWVGSFDDWQMEVESFHEAGDRVVAIVRQRGRAKVGGVEVDMRFAQVFTVRDGRQSRMEMYSEPEEAMRAAGLGG